METILANGIRIYFDLEERGTAETIQHACERSVQIISEQWGMTSPTDCRVYVMTSWAYFIFHSAPWHWKILLILTYPLWVFRVRRTWQIAGGWTQRYGKRCAIGVKPPWLIEVADRSVGERIFVKEESFEQKVQLITCHELTHAFTAHLKLPMWLNEGIAMVMVDNFLGTSTVKENTLRALQHSGNKQSPGMYQSVSMKDQDSLVYHTVRGYWITRYLMDTRPDLLKKLLEQRQSHKDLEEKIASSYDMGREEFWKAIDGMLIARFLTDR
jgi:hypothetical protein